MADSQLPTNPPLQYVIELPKNCLLSHPGINNLIRSIKNTSWCFRPKHPNLNMITRVFNVIVYHKEWFPAIRLCWVSY